MHARALWTVCASIVLILTVGASPARNHVIPNSLWQGLPSCGDEGREEREYKFTLQGAGLGELDADGLATEIRQALEKNVKAATWQVPQLVASSYILDAETGDPVFVDIYYDTPDNLNYESDVSYRFRMRFGSTRRIQNFVNKSVVREDQPRRMEYQVKVDRKWAPEGGFSTVRESRCEGDMASGFPIPFPLTDLRPFLVSAETGVLEVAGKSYVLQPAQVAVEFFKQKAPLAHAPVLVLETERRRDHFNIDAQLGLGVRQTFIITLDKARIYRVDTYLPWLLGEVKDKPSPLSTPLDEVEVEFDRSTAELLNRQIEGTTGEKRNRLIKLRDAFLADQSALMELVKKRFEEISGEKKNPSFLYVVPGQRSKYRQAKDLLPR